MEDSKLLGGKNISKRQDKILVEKQKKHCGFERNIIVLICQKLCDKSRTCMRNTIQQRSRVMKNFNFEKP